MRVVKHCTFNHKIITNTTYKDLAAVENYFLVLVLLISLVCTITISAAVVVTLNILAAAELTIANND